MIAERQYLLGSKSSKWAIYKFHLADYMHRWILKTPFKKLWKVPLSNIRLHHILRSDLDTALHDHPFGFWTVLLTGSYIEVLPPKESGVGCQIAHRGWLSVRWVDAEQAHRLILTKPVWTLVFAEKSHRDWGFYVGGFKPEHWVSHEEYLGIKEEE